MVERIGNVNEFNSLVKTFYSGSEYDAFKMAIDRAIKQLVDEGVFDNFNFKHELNRKEFLLMVSEKDMLDAASWKKIVAIMRDAAKYLTGLPCLYVHYSNSKYAGTYTSTFTGDIYRHSSSSGTLYGFEAEGSADVGKDRLFINYWDLA